MKTLAHYFEKSFLSAKLSVTESTATLSSDMIAGIWNGTTDPQAWIRNGATSMSNIIRNTVLSNRSEYDGNAYQMGVKVRWEVVSLPVVTVLLPVLLLIAVMLKTAYSPVNAWKGRPLTVLLLNADEKIEGASAGRDEEARGLKNAIGRTRVRLSRRLDKMWALKAC